MANTVITFTVVNQSAYDRTIEFWDLANNNHAILDFAPSQSRPLSLLTKDEGDGTMKYRFLPHGAQPGQWYQRNYIKNGDIIVI